MGSPSQPSKGCVLPARCCGSRRCKKARKSRHAVGHSSECARGEDGQKLQDAFVSDADPELTSIVKKLRDQWQKMPEGLTTKISDLKNSIHPSVQVENLAVKQHILDPLELEEPLGRALTRTLKYYGYTEELYKMMEPALRLRLSVISKSKMGQWWKVPYNLLSAAKDWVMQAAVQTTHGKLLPLFKEVYGLVQSQKVVALCTGHTDAFQRAGYWHPKAVEVLTVFCSSKDPVYVLVVSTDLRTDWGKDLAKADLVDVALYEVRDGQSIIMPGTTGQTCCHIVFGPVGSVCFRLRSFWLPADRE